MKRILPLLALTILLASCAALQKLALKEPTVEYSKVRLQTLNFSHIELLVDFNVTNPNKLSLDAKSYQWAMSIGGKEFVSGHSAAPLTVPGGQSSLVQVPVRLGFSELFAAFGDLLANDSVQYEVALKTELDVPILGSRTVPVTTKGYIPVPKMPRFRIDDFELTNFSLAGSTVTLKVRVENPNYFGITMSNATYALKVNNEEWINSRLNRTLDILPKSDVVLNIPIEVNMQRWGTTVYRILTRGEEFAYDLQGKGDVRVGLPQFTDVVTLPFGLSGRRTIQR